MAKKILAAAPAVCTHQYRLPETDRQAILAKTPWHITRLKIEHQRQAFMQRNNGCAYGQKANLSPSTK